MNQTRKILRTVVVLAAIAGLGAVGAFSAFSSQTENPNNIVSTGTVNLTDNDNNDATPLYDLLNARPGDTESHCITVTYTGSLPAGVRFWTTSVPGALAQHVSLRVQTGAGGNFDCTGFTPDAGAALFDNTLNNFPTTAAGALVDGPGAATTWNQNDAVTYRFTATLPAGVGNAAQGLSTNLHTIRWEATSQ